MMAISSPRIRSLEFSKPIVKRVFPPSSGWGCTSFPEPSPVSRNMTVQASSTPRPCDRGRRRVPSGGAPYQDLEWSSLPATCTQGTICLEKGGNGFWAKKPRTYLLYSSPLTSKHTAILFLIHINIKLLHLAQCKYSHTTNKAFSQETWSKFL